MVKCAQHVGGPQSHECSLSEFEKLGNSKERRPGENIHLSTYKLALKVSLHSSLATFYSGSVWSRHQQCSKPHYPDF